MNRWTADLAAEQLLAQNGVKWSIESIPVTSIDIKASRANRARVQPIDDEFVTAYAIAMRRGDAFPRPVIARVGSSYVIVGGNHRIAACMQAGVEHVEAMMIIVDDMMFDTIAKALNTRNGKAPTLAEKMDQAVAMCVTHKMTAAAAAEQVGLDPTTVASKLRIYELRLAATRAGVDCKQKDNVLLPISTLTKTNEAVAVHALKVIGKQVVTKDDVSELRKAIDSQKSEAKKIEAIETWANTRTTRKTMKAASAPIRKAIVYAAKTLSKNIDNAEILTQTQLPASEAREVMEMISKTATRLKRLLGDG